MYGVTVPPSDSDYVHTSAFLQQFRLIHPCRTRRSRRDEGGRQYQALDHFILRLPLRQKQVDRRLMIVTVPGGTPSHLHMQWCSRRLI